MVNQNNGGGNGATAHEEATPRTIQQDLQAQGQGMLRSGQLATYVCAECGGILWQIEENRHLHFQCHVGHTYTPQVLLQQKSQVLEATLWAAVRTLVEKGTLVRQLVNRLPVDADPEQRAVIEQMAQIDNECEQTLRRMLEAYPNPGSQGYIVTEALEKA